MFNSAFSNSSTTNNANASQPAPDNRGTYVSV
jgi:hypothetical protein